MPYHTYHALLYEYLYLCLEKHTDESCHTHIEIYMTLICMPYHTHQALLCMHLHLCLDKHTTHLGVSCVFPANVHDSWMSHVTHM